MSDLMSIIKKSCQFIQSLLFHHEKSAFEALSIAFYSQAQEGANQLQMQNLSKALGPTLVEEVQPMLNGCAPHKLQWGSGKESSILARKTAYAAGSQMLI